MFLVALVTASGASAVSFEVLARESSDIPVPGTESFGRQVDLNESGQVVFFASLDDFDNVIYRWDDGVATDVVHQGIPGEAGSFFSFEQVRVAGDGTIYVVAEFASGVYGLYRESAGGLEQLVGQDEPCPFEPNNAVFEDVGLFFGTEGARFLLNPGGVLTSMVTCGGNNHLVRHAGTELVSLTGNFSETVTNDLGPDLLLDGYDGKTVLGIDGRVYGVASATCPDRDFCLPGASAGVYGLLTLPAGGSWAAAQAALGQGTQGEAPGLEAGEKINRVVRLTTASNGEVAFLAELTTFDYAIFEYSPIDGVRMIVREGDELQDGDVVTRLVVGTGGDLGLSVLAFSDDGVMFSADVNGTADTDGMTILRAPNLATAAIQVMASPNDTAPGIPGATVGRITQLVSSPDGRFAFHSELGGAPDEATTAIFANDFFNGTQLILHDAQTLTLAGEQVTMRPRSLELPALAHNYGGLREEFVYGNGGDGRGSVINDRGDLVVVTTSDQFIDYLLLVDIEGDPADPPVGPDGGPLPRSSAVIEPTSVRIEGSQVEIVDIYDANGECEVDFNATPSNVVDKGEGPVETVPVVEVETRFGSLEISAVDLPVLDEVWRTTVEVAYQGSGASDVVDCDYSGTETIEVEIHDAEQFIPPPDESTCTSLEVDPRGPPLALALLALLALVGRRR
jgi:MYXO-CTERM domain-containing protein